MINVTSTVTVKTLPVIGVYRVSKAAVNALAESFAVEMEPLACGYWSSCRAARQPRASAERPHFRGLDDADYAPMLQQFINSVGRHRARDSCLRRRRGHLARRNRISGAAAHSSRRRCRTLERPRRAL